MCTTNDILKDVLIFCKGSQEVKTRERYLFVFKGKDGYTLMKAPLILDDMRYAPGRENRMIRVYHRMDVHLDLEDFFAKLQLNFR